MELYPVILLCFLLSCGASASSSRSLRAVQCPDSFLITPCVCSLSNNLLNLTCSDLPTLKTLVDIFGRTFPTNELHRLTVTRSQLGSLPNDIFNGKSFEIIEFINNQVVSFENSQIFVSSKARLKTLKIVHDSDNWSMSLNNFAGFNVLEYLEVGGYAGVLTGGLSDLPALTELILRTEKITSLPSLASLPALEVLDFDGSTLQSLPSGSFSNVPTVKSLYLGHNKIAEIVSGNIALGGPLEVVDLSANLITSVQTNPITGESYCTHNNGLKSDFLVFLGMSSSTTLNLVGNYITQLPESVFQPIVDLFSQGSGQLLVDGNPMECGCEVAWIIINSEYLSHVPDGRCVNGTKFVNLNPAYYVNNC